MRNASKLAAQKCKSPFPSGRAIGLAFPDRIRSRIKCASRATSVFLLLLSSAISISAQGPQQQVDLTQTSIEDLLNVEISTVSKSDRKLSETPAAVFVISQSDIARSGATNIPDLLRMVPGMDVAQIGANTWAISARGLNGRFSNELQVMVDGRSVYTPTFGGVFWDTLDMPLEDIDRIEVIRGSASSVWGANAVNGVVNIITKTAEETRGGLVVAGAGNVDQAFGTVQYGGDIGGATTYRAYAKYFNDAHLNDLQGVGGADGWHMFRIGARVDAAITSKDTISIRGDFYQGTEGQPVTMLPSISSPARVDVDTAVPKSGGFLQGVWKHTSSARSDFELDVSYDHYYVGDVLNESRHSLTVDFQQHNHWGERQRITWGLNFRDSLSRTTGSLTFSLNPANLNTENASAFVEDEISVIPQRLNLTIGTKLNYDYYTGLALMPTVRLAWMPDSHNTAWVGVSRSLRTPAALDTISRLNLAGFTGPGGEPAVAALIGNPNIESENEISVDAGHRASLTDRLSVDIAVYFNHYDDQETAEPAAPYTENTPLPAHTVFPLVFENLMHGDGVGFEAFATWNAFTRWTLSPGYAFENIRMKLEAGSQDVDSVQEAEGASPVNSAQLRSNVSLPHHLTWNLSTYFVGRLRDPAIPAYTRVDTGMIWNFGEHLSFSMFGQNLLQSQHEEFVDSTGSIRTTLMKRGGYLKVTWTF